MRLNSFLLMPCMIPCTMLVAACAAAPPPAPAQVHDPGNGPPPGEVRAHMRTVI